jgi:tRNA nucleotidyltransferase/poly(A) polymerase
MIHPEDQRRFAVEVVCKLRDAGFTAYWAGGCVRDQLLGCVPKDYDVATSATPPQIRRVFGRHRTLAIGAAFGVISVVGPKSAGMVEVSTFRRDAAYSDGRHPDSVTFSSPEEDAARRDFTINGLFFDPIEQRIIDFVEGQRDLAAGRVRAIGDARQRFSEDKLRMLRAVRFTATLGFALDDESRRAIREMAGEIRVVSPERIAMEMRRILVDANRARAVRLLLDTGLAEVVLPEIVPHDAVQQAKFDRNQEVLARLGSQAFHYFVDEQTTGQVGREQPVDARKRSSVSFPLALAALLCPWVDATAAEAICLRWRLSNQETERAVWLVAHRNALDDAQSQRWSAIQPILTDQGGDELLALLEAASPAEAEAASYCRKLLARPREMVDPPPILTGRDLLALGIPSGPRYKVLLQYVRDAQLDQEIRTKAEALAWVAQWQQENPDPTSSSPRSGIHG